MINDRLYYYHAPNDTDLLDSKLSVSRIERRTVIQRDARMQLGLNLAPD